jgi:hypothetical protein
MKKRRGLPSSCEAPVVGERRRENTIRRRSPGLLSLRGACDEAGPLSDQTPPVTADGTLVDLRTSRCQPRADRSPCCNGQCMERARGRRPGHGPRVHQSTSEMRLGGSGATSFGAPGRVSERGPAHVASSLNSGGSTSGKLNQDLRCMRCFRAGDRAPRWTWVRRRRGQVGPHGLLAAARPRTSVQRLKSISAPTITPSLSHGQPGRWLNRGSHGRRPN